ELRPFFLLGASGWGAGALLATLALPGTLDGISLRTHVVGDEAALFFRDLETFGSGEDGNLARRQVTDAKPTLGHLFRFLLLFLGGVRFRLGRTDKKKQRSTVGCEGQSSALRRHGTAKTGPRSGPRSGSRGGRRRCLGCRGAAGADGVAPLGIGFQVAQ